MQHTNKERILSLDVMRGIIMILLAGESALVYTSLSQLKLPSFIHVIILQFFHQPWQGMRFWDTVQPAFMMMAGSALYISCSRKFEKGETWSLNLRHIAIRSLKLFLLGTALHCVYAGKLVWELWNVLTQLAFTSLMAYLVIKKSSYFQIAFGVFLVMINDLLYRTIHIANYNYPYTEFHNFGAYIDTILMGKINTDGWVAFNIVPTAAHTIWGMTIGKLLISSKAPLYKIKILIVVGCLSLLIGYSMDWLNIVPIIKRISTGSFVYASTGWVMLMLAFVYWVIDVKKKNKYARIATVVGMNSIFIYLFFETLGAQWINNTVFIFIGGFTSLFQITTNIQVLLSSFVVWLLEWYLCYWLAKKNIFIKL
ncbi:acyltransferase family protein [Rhizosphaericola mali]|uniref:DUF5009 domain-containing protein n=1 Tax=Rhizosphaericola mali TaxID=2545455 RepID=A0A5P2GG61_9BACT|nr:DUF5009 domain-containing protein [Rhizosphaericola mali]QES90691.1 DUF5009 domain-containing protein [Rhizosphaericola mali]